ncbi:MAG: DHHA1 domain-containing protein, partial [Desulfobacterales bacterium]
AALLLREHPDAVVQRIEKILSHQKALEKELEHLKAGIAAQSVHWAQEDIKTIDGVQMLVKKVSVEKPAELRDLADRFKEKLKSGVVVLGGTDTSKALLIVVVTKDLTDRFHAGKMIKEIASVVGGGGGGRPDMAQAGGSRPEKLDEALEKAYEVVEKIAGANIS